MSRDKQHLHGDLPEKHRPVLPKSKKQNVLASALNPDPIWNLSAKENVLLEELQKLQEKKQWLMDVLKNVGYSDLDRFKNSYSLGNHANHDSSSPNMQNYQLNESLKDRALPEDIPVQPQRNGQINPNSTINDKRMLKDRQERLHILSDSSHLLNIQLQEKLRELSQGQQSSEFSSKDPHNFINTYARKLGYLSAGKKGSKLRTQSPTVDNVADKSSPVSKLPLASSEYENDFEMENSAQLSPVALLPRRNFTADIGQPLRKEEGKRSPVPLMTRKTSILERPQMTLVHAANESAPAPGNSSNQFAVSLPGIKLTPVLPNRGVILDVLPSPKLVRAEIVEDAENGKEEINRSARSPGQVQPIAPFVIPPTSYFDIDVTSQSQTGINKASSASSSEGDRYSPRSSPRSGRILEKANQPIIESSVNGEIQPLTLKISQPVDNAEPIPAPNADIYPEPGEVQADTKQGEIMDMTMMNVNFAPLTRKQSPTEADKVSMEIDNRASSVSSVPLDLSDSASDEDGNLNEMIKPRSIEELNQFPKMPSKSKSSSTLSSVSDAFMPSDTEDEVIVPHGDQNVPDIESSSVHSASEVSSVKSDFLSTSSQEDQTKLEDHHSIHSEVSKDEHVPIEIAAEIPGPLKQVIREAKVELPQQGILNDINETLPATMERDTLEKISSLSKEIQAKTDSEHSGPVAANDAELSPLDTVSSLTALSDESSQSGIVSKPIGLEELNESKKQDNLEVHHPKGTGLANITETSPQIIADDPSFILAKDHISVEPFLEALISNDGGQELFIPFEVDIHLPVGGIFKHEHRPHSASSLSSVSEDLISSEGSINHPVTTVNQNATLHLNSVPNLIQLEKRDVPSSIQQSLPKPLHPAAHAVEDWIMDEDLFAGILPTSSESQEELTGFNLPQRPAEAVRQDKLGKILPLTEDIARHVFRSVKSGKISHFDQVNPMSLDDSTESRMVFDSIVDLCEQMYQLPNVSSSGQSFDSKPSFPNNMDKFIQLMTNHIKDKTARLVLSDTLPTPITGRGDQDELEQQAVYKLAFQDLERTEEDWCNFKEGESLLKDQSANVIFDDLVNEVVLDIQQDEAKKRQLLSTQRN